MSGEGAVNVQVQKARRLHDADVVYLYDSSFEGFLCCVFESFAQHEIPFAVWTPQQETSTLYPVKDIPTDHAKAQRVFASFGRKLGPETEYLVSRDFLSGREDKELLLIPGAVHTDLYDRMDIIPFDRIEAFYHQYLK